MVTTIPDISGWQRLAPHPSFQNTVKKELWANNTIWQAAEAIAERDPNRITHVFDDQPYDIGYFLQQAETLAAALYERGLRPGDAVAFQLPNWVETVVIDLAAALSGLVVVPIISIYRDAEVEYMLRDCNARAVFTCGEFRGFDHQSMMRRIVRQLPSVKLLSTIRCHDPADADAYENLLQDVRILTTRPQVDPDSVKVVLYTSGTTGSPKAVLHSHNTLAYTIRICMHHWGIQAGETLLMASPVTHLTGYGAGIELPWLYDMRAAIMERWDPDQGIRMIEREGASISLGATPFLHELLEAAVRHQSRLPTLRAYPCGGTAVPPSLIRRASEVLAQCRAFRVYGSSETPMVTLGFHEPELGESAATTDGRVVHYEVRITDDDGKQLPVGQEGEIRARGPGMFLGYGKREQTEETVDEDGFYITGDLGVLDADMALTITGRKKDLINRGGEKLSAKEIEDILHQHPEVAEASVVAMPHTRLGETVCAYIIASAQSGLTPEAVIRHVQDSGVARQKCPERVEIVDQLPKNASGKVRKDLLRADIRRRIEEE